MRENLTTQGYTADPNEPDTDGDGLLDGIELMFTRWNATDENMDSQSAYRW